MFSDKLARDVFDYVEKNGLESAKEHFNIKESSIERYVRRAKAVAREAIDKRNESMPKVLFFDLETAPLRGLFWGLWKQNVDAIKQLKNNWFLFCYSAKWLGHTEILNDRLTSEEAKSQDDKRITKSLWELMNEADVVVAHNLIKFDRKRANTRFLINGMTPPSPYRLIDTLVQVKKEFALPSNRMDYINKVLGLSRKIDTGGMELWNKCYDGEEEALTQMQEYCDGDVIALEDTYFALAPWFRGNINFGIYSNEEVEICSHCGSKNVNLTDASYTTNVSVFPVYKCSDCGGYSRSRYSKLTLKKRKSLLTSLGS